MAAPSRADRFKEADYWITELLWDQPAAGWDGVCVCVC